MDKAAGRVSVTKTGEGVDIEIRMPVGPLWLLVAVIFLGSILGLASQLIQAWTTRTLDIGLAFLRILTASACASLAWLRLHSRYHHETVRIRPACVWGSSWISQR